jgi:hypothetical protein
VALYHTQAKGATYCEILFLTRAISRDGSDVGREHPPSLSLPVVCILAGGLVGRKTFFGLEAAYSRVLRIRSRLRKSRSSCATKIGILEQNTRRLMEAWLLLALTIPQGLLQQQRGVLLSQLRLSSKYRPGVFIALCCRTHFYKNVCGYIGVTR